MGIVTIFLSIEFPEKVNKPQSPVQNGIKNVK